MKIINYIALVFIFFSSYVSKTFALIEVDITRGNLNPLPIAISPLAQNEKSEKESTRMRLDKEATERIVKNALGSQLKEDQMK